MSLGGVFLLIACMVFFLTGLGVQTVPGVDMIAHACLCLGILLAGRGFGPFWRHP